MSFFDFLGLSSKPTPQSAPKRAPRVGDVVHVYLPSPDNPNRPGTKSRPAVVHWVKSQPDGTLALDVSPGYPEDGKPLRAGEAIVDTKNGLASAGLSKSTRFDLNQRSVVPWKMGYIAFKDGAPILGTLIEKDFEKVRAAYRSSSERQNRSKVMVAAQRQANRSMTMSESFAR